jgi:hypothetical protein
MDMLLNATLTPLTWLTAGALLGHAEKLRQQSAGAPRYALGQTAMNTARPSGKRTVL